MVSIASNHAYLLAVLSLLNLLSLVSLVSSNSFYYAVFPANLRWDCSLYSSMAEKLRSLKILISTKKKPFWSWTFNELRAHIHLQADNYLDFPRFIVTPGGFPTEDSQSSINTDTTLDTYHSSTKSSKFVQSVPLHWVESRVVIH